MRLSTGLIAAAMMMGTAVSASANGVVVLNFEGVNATYPSGYANIRDFYNGGVSSDGTSGTNYGVSFSDNALAMCMNTPGVSCSNTSRGGFAPGSEFGGLFFLSGDETILDYSAGFTTGFSFVYSQPNTQGGQVRVYDGLGGTGALLGSISLGLTSSTCGGQYGATYCPFEAVGVAFGGTAKSIVFAGVANYVVFDDITFGSVTPGEPTVPEPATWAMMIMGFGLVGYSARRRRSEKIVLG